MPVPRRLDRALRPYLHRSREAAPAHRTTVVRSCAAISRRAVGTSAAGVWRPAILGAAGSHRSEAPCTRGPKRPGAIPRWRCAGSAHRPMECDTPTRTSPSRHLLRGDRDPSATRPGRCAIVTESGSSRDLRQRPIRALPPLPSDHHPIPSAIGRLNPGARRLRRRLPTPPQVASRLRAPLTPSRSLTILPPDPKPGVRAGRLGHDRHAEPPISRPPRSTAGPG